MTVSNETLKRVLTGLNSGKMYCGIDKYNHGVGIIYKTSHGNIGWQHFGSSANRFTLNELKFVLEKIFGDCMTITEAVWNDDFLNYIPKDKKYKGINLNRKCYTPRNL